MQKVKTLHSENKPVAITGPSGVGKTEFALQYASIYNKIFNADVYWVDCRTVGEMLNAIYNLADDFGILVKSNTTDTLIEDMFTFLRSSDTLFVFDDAEVNNTFIWSLSSILHRHNKLRILITSRELKWNATLYSIIKLDSFNKQEAIQFLKVKLQNYDLDLKEGVYNSFPDDLEYIPQVLENVTDIITCQPEFKVKGNGWVEDIILSRLRMSTDKREDKEKEKLINTKLAKENIHICVKNGIVNATSVEWADAQYQRLKMYHRLTTGQDWP